MQDGGKDRIGGWNVWTKPLLTATNKPKAKTKEIEIIYEKSKKWCLENLNLIEEYV